MAETIVHSHVFYHLALDVDDIDSDSIGMRILDASCRLSEVVVGSDLDSFGTPCTTALKIGVARSVRLS